MEQQPMSSVPDLSFTLSHLWLNDFYSQWCVCGQWFYRPSSFCSISRHTHRPISRLRASAYTGPHMFTVIFTLSNEYFMDLIMVKVSLAYYSCITCWNFLFIRLLREVKQILMLENWAPCETSTRIGCSYSLTFSCQFTLKFRRYIIELL